MSRERQKFEATVVVQAKGKIPPATKLASSVVKVISPTPTTALAVPDSQIVAMHRGACGKLFAEAQMLMVRDPSSLAIATTMLLEAKAAAKEVMEKRDFFVKPLKDHVKQIEALFKPLIDTLSQADATLRSKVLEYRVVEQRKADELRAEAERRATIAAEEAARLAEKAASLTGKRAAAAQFKSDAKQDEANVAALAMLAAQGPARVMPSIDGQVATRRVWRFEVEDESQVPREYLVVNESEIREAVRNGVREIPGVRIFSQEQLSVGGK